MGGRGGQERQAGKVLVVWRPVHGRPDTAEDSCAEDSFKGTYQQLPALLLGAKDVLMSRRRG